MQLSYDYAAGKKKSTAVLYLDVKAAYASISRDLILPPFEGQASEGAYVRKLAEVMFTVPDAQDIYHDTTQLACWYESGGSEHLIRYVQDVYSHPWFSFEGLKGAIVAKIGALAGTLFADLLFIVAASKFFRSNLSVLHSEGLEVKLNPDLASQLFGDIPGLDSDTRRIISEVSFVDDAAVAIISSAIHLLKDLTTAISSIDDIFLAHGPSLNFTKGKSEAVLEIRGAGSGAVTMGLAKDLDVKLPSKNCLGERKTLLCTDKYKHLGSERPKGGALMPEVICRTGSIMSAYHELGKTIICNDRIPLAARANIVTMYLMSKGLYNTYTWKSLGIAEARKFHGCIMRIYRELLCLDAPHGEHCTDDQVITKLGAFAPLTMVAYMRIKLLVRVTKHDNTVLIVLISNVAAYTHLNTWVTALVDSLQK